MTEAQIKAYYERIFCLIDNCPWHVYLKLREMEAKDIEKLKQKSSLEYAPTFGGIVTNRDAICF